MLSVSGFVGLGVIFNVITLPQQQLQKPGRYSLVFLTSNVMS